MNVTSASVIKEALSSALFFGAGTLYTRLVELFSVI